MANGTRGDHPLTDMLIHELAPYGDECSALVRKIERLSSREELHDWWNSTLGYDPSDSAALRECRRRHAELLKRAEERGWEID